MITGKTVAVVGNGPSGNGQGPAIDGCDFVVRMKNWRTCGPVNAGQKLSALVGFNSQWTDIPKELEIRRDWELWCPYPTFEIVLDPQFKTPETCVDWRWVLQIADGRIIRTISRSASAEMVNYMRSLSSIPGVFTTAGAAAIAMAIERFPGQLHLWGFDRVDDTAGNPHNDWGQVALTAQIAKKNTMHDFVAEKKMISELVDKVSWCGKPINFPVIWHGRPNASK
jgi:hypothetical protein